MSISSTRSIVVDFTKEYILIGTKLLKTLFVNKVPSSWAVGDKGVVILIPGFAETWVFLEKIGNYLNSEGYKVNVIPSLGRNTRTVTSLLGDVKRFIEGNGLENIIIIAHSKGGIVAKALIDEPEYMKKISKVFNLAVPYHGTIWGQMRIFSLNEFLPESQNSKLMKRAKENNAKIINIYPRFDNHVIPHKNLILQGAKNIQLNIIGHTRILESKATIDLIRQYL